MCKKSGVCGRCESGVESVECVSSWECVRSVWEVLEVCRKC